MRMWAASTTVGFGARLRVTSSPYREAALLLFLFACAAEDPTSFTFKLSNISSPGQGVAADGTTYDLAFAPGLVIIHDPSLTVFTPGTPIGRPELEALAEDGDPTSLYAAIEQDPAVTQLSYLQYTDEVDYHAAPMGPGVFAFTTAEIAPDTLFSVLFMYGQSNDVVIAGLGLSAFDEADAPISTELSSALAFYDLGTEQNQEPGVGADQAPRQSAPNTGTAESGVVARIDGVDAEGYSYPSAAEILTLELYPTADAATTK